VTPANIDDFYYATAEMLTSLYVAFPVRHLLLVEDITGPIRWDMTGLPDRKSRACFEAMIWHSEHELLTFRSVEPRDIGVEGAVLTQRAFVLLNGLITWEEGGSMSRIDAMIEARRQRAYDDLGTIVQDLLRANCQWGAPVVTPRLVKAPPIAVGTEEA